MNDDANRSRGLALGDPALLEQRDVYAGRGEHVRGCTTHGAAADYRDVSVESSAMSRICRTPRSRKAIQPVDSPVTCFGQRGNIL